MGISNTVLSFQCLSMYTVFHTLQNKHVLFCQLMAVVVCYALIPSVTVISDH